MPRNLILYVIAGLAGFLVFGVLRALLGDEVGMILAAVALIVCIVVVYRNLQTNRKVAEATPQQRTEALAFAPPAGKAALYVFRNQFVGRVVGINVLIDGREVAQLKSPRFTHILLTPGAHRIAGYTGTNKKPGDNEGVALNAVAGEALVLKCEVEPQLVGVSVKFTPLALDAGRTDVAKIARMVVPDVAEI
ncbi:MAG: hypothetical protein DCF16_08635 [Alphaproteobacteria bacterium]|nr:MAG: hypothetical protein DCF16_08635 [Alphaproteobacteria bacterium]